MHRFFWGISIMRHLFEINGLYDQPLLPSAIVSTLFYHSKFIRFRICSFLINKKKKKVGQGMSKSYVVYDTEIYLKLSELIFIKEKALSVSGNCFLLLMKLLMLFKCLLFCYNQWILFRIIHITVCIDQAYQIHLRNKPTNFSPWYQPSDSKVIVVTGRYVKEKIFICTLYI